jgi:yecA family protein
MPENQDFEYQPLSDALERAAASTQAADCHGLLCGLICASGFADPKVWVAEVFEDFNPRDLLQAEAFRLLQSLYEDTLGRLNSAELDFELLLPDPACSLRERTESLGEWCSGFLSGLGIGGLPASAQLPEEVAELLEDLAQIARVDFDLDQPSEEDQIAFEEVVEYIRVGTLLIHEELQPAVPPQRLS